MISLSGNTGATISHSETSSKHYERLGYLHNIGYMSNMSEMSDQTILLAWAD